MPTPAVRIFDLDLPSPPGGQRLPLTNHKRYRNSNRRACTSTPVSTSSSERSSMPPAYHLRCTASALRSRGRHHRGRWCAQSRAGECEVSPATRTEADEGDREKEERCGCSSQVLGGKIRPRIAQSSGAPRLGLRRWCLQRASSFWPRKPHTTTKLRPFSICWAPLVCSV